MMKLSDHHCHISKEYFDDPIAEIKRLEETSGLECVCVMGCDYDNNAEYLAYKDVFPGSFLQIGLGLHPYEVIELGEMYPYELKRVREQIENNLEKIHFVGEIGIDKTYDGSIDTLPMQIDAFRQMCTIGKQYGKPLSIHARESWEEVMQVIDEVNFDKAVFNGYLHSFTGSYDQAKFFLDRGFKLGLNGIVTYKKTEELRRVIKRLLDEYGHENFDGLFGLETDTPYLTPEPNRREKNTPENIKVIAQFLENYLQAS